MGAAVGAGGTAWLARRWVRHRRLAVVPLLLIVLLGTTGTMLAIGTAQRTSTAFAVTSSAATSPTSSSTRRSARRRPTRYPIAAGRHRGHDRCPLRRHRRRWRTSPAWRDRGQREEPTEITFVFGSHDGRYVDADRPVVEAAGSRPGRPRSPSARRRRAPWGSRSATSCHSPSGHRGRPRRREGGRRVLGGGGRADRGRAVDHRRSDQDDRRGAAQRAVQPAPGDLVARHRPPLRLPAAPARPGAEPGREHRHRGPGRLRGVLPLLRCRSPTVPPGSSRRSRSSFAGSSRSTPSWPRSKTPPGWAGTAPVS